MNEMPTTEVKVLSTQGRIGRLRFIAYSLMTGVIFFAVYLVFAAVLGIGAGVMGASGSPEGAMAFGGILMLFILALIVAATVLKFIWAVRRAHDMNVSGWLSLILLVPFGEFVFWFAPGTDGENQYGPPPPPNGTGVVVAVILPLVLFVLFFVFAILAAISIPAYQGYIERSRELQGQAPSYERQYAPQYAPGGSGAGGGSSSQ